MDGARCVRKRERQLNLLAALNDLKRVRHVHRAWSAWQVALELGIAVDPVLAVFLPHRRGFRLVRNLAIALHHAERCRNAGRSAERHDGRGSNLGIFVRVNARLRDHSRSRAVCLQIPIRLVVRLPDAAEIGLAVRGTGGITRNSAPRPAADSCRDDDGDDNSCPTSGAGLHDFSSYLSGLASPPSSANPPANPPQAPRHIVAGFGPFPIANARSC